MRTASDLLLALILAAATVTDLRSRRIPNRLLATGVAIGLPLLTLADPGSLGARIATMAAAGGAFLLVSLIRPGGFGMGDVKLIATMGLFLGPGALEAVMVALCSASLLGLVLLVRDGRGALRSTLPFAPFLALGGLTSLLGVLPTLQ